MMKVILTETGEQKTDLFPEQSLIREVLEKFCVSGIGVCIDGRMLREEDLDKRLNEFGKDSVVRIVSFLKSGEDPEDLPKNSMKEIPESCSEEADALSLEDGSFTPGGFVQIHLEEDKYREAYHSLVLLRDALDTALEKLKQAELPF